MAIAAARGLSFLHEAEAPVIYRDFKASNILLDAVRQLFLLRTQMIHDLVVGIVNGNFEHCYCRNSMLSFLILVWRGLVPLEIELM